ncbi:MAG: hypothetical protein AABX32_01085 [Nanoarchaeota archaeon]
MNKKIKEILGIIELGLLSFLPSYSLPQATAQFQQQPSVLENIIENSNSEKTDTPVFYAPRPHGKIYSEGTYRKILNDYMQLHIRSKEDMTSRVPLKWLNIHPETTMGGVLGFTYIGDPSMGRRADLTGWTARMVDIHESIHTPDEYETRVLTSWIMEKAVNKYFK